MVLSCSGKVPHLVTPTKGGGFSYDGNCPNWKSLGFCSHSIAVAKLNKNLMSSLLTHMPSGHGCKVNVAPSTRKAVQSPDSRMSMTIGGN